jgi:hypothetical protein
MADAPAEAGVFAQLYGYCPIGADWERALLTDSGEQLVVIPRRNFKYRHEVAPAPGQSARQTEVRQAEVRPIDAELALQIDRRFRRAISRNSGDAAAATCPSIGCPGRCSPGTLTSIIGTTRPMCGPGRTGRSRCRERGIRTHYTTGQCSARCLIPSNIRRSITNSTGFNIKRSASANGSRQRQP